MPDLAAEAALATPLRFHTLDTRALRTSLTPYQIAQDSLGFLWFATGNGLIRYDGTDLRAFEPIPFDTTSLVDPWVPHLTLDRDDGIWLAMESGGLIRYDARREAFQRFPSVTPVRLSDLAREADGTLWIATSYEGLLRYDPATGDTTRYATAPGAPASLPDRRLRSLLLGRDGMLWIGTHSAGLARLNPRTGEIRTFPSRPDETGGLPAARVEALAEDANGRLWVGTFGGGVARYDPTTDTFVRVDVPGTAADKHDNVNALFVDPVGALWIGSDAGLDRLDPVTDRVTSYRHQQDDPTSIAAGGVYSIFLDRTGVLWVGLDGAIAHAMWTSSHFEQITHDPADPASLYDDYVNVVYEDRDGTVWAGTDGAETEGALNRIDLATGRVTHILPDASDPTRLAPGYVFGIFETRDGAFWVASRGGGLQRVDRETGRVVERFQGTEADTTSLFSEIPWWVLEDSRGRTWITSGGEGCLHQMHRETGTFTRFCHDPDDPNTPAYDFARYMIEAQDGALWLGTWGGGLDRIDPETGAFTHYRHDPTDRNTPSSDFILFVGEGADGVLWLGTYGGGFSRFDPATETFTHYTTDNSALPSNVVYGIQPDDAGRLWMSTEAGLVRFDPASEAFRTYQAEDGVQGIEFASGSSFRSPSGTLFFGGLDGLVAFDPARVVADEVAPPVVLTRLQVGGETVVPAAEDSPLTEALPYASEIRLRPEQRDLAITFAGLTFAAPEANQFRYRLEGYDDDWHTPGRDQTATYTNLDPGRYTFTVRAANADGVWNDIGASVAVIVAPHLYETWWARVLYALALCGGLLWIARTRRNRLRMEHRLEIESVEAEQLRQLDRAKSHFFANVSHEFRTPLTLTLGPLDDVLAGEYGPLPDDAAAPIGLARRSAERVLGLINQILDLSRLEAGSTRLQARRLDLADFVRAQVGLFGSIAVHRGLGVDVKVPDAPVEVWADPDHAATILANLLSNAFKFTPEGGSLHVSVEADDRSARVTVRDSGPGIADHDLAHVFDRFYQAEGSDGQALGSGIGLALAHDLATLHGGTLTAESTVGVGSAFTIAFPRGRAHLAPDQIDDQPWDESLGAAPVPDHAAEPAAEAARDDDRTTILVVDDQADIRAYVRRHLERADYRVVEAADGEDALAVVRERLPDLVVSDVMMPRLDGLGLCRALRSSPDTDFLPILLLTAKASPEDRLDGLAEACDAYLTKPFDVRELVARVGNLIALRHRLRERFAAPAGDGAADPASPPSGDGAADRSSPPPSIASADDALVATLRATVEAHLSDETFTVAAFAEAVGMSRGHLLRRTSALLDMTPSEVIRTARLDRAAELLAADAGTVSEVAYGVGFKSVAHFSDAFLDRHGCRPSVYPGEAT